MSAPATDVPDEPAAVPPARGRAVPVLAGLAVVLLAVGTVFAVLAVQHLRSRDALDHARNAALAAGRQEIVNLDSLSAVTIDHDLTQVVNGATGTFRDQFTRSQADLKGLIVAHKTASSGTIRSAAVEGGDLDSATLLVAADRQVSDSSTPTGATAHDRWKVYMERRGGRWLMARLEPAP